MDIHAYMYAHACPPEDVHINVEIHALIHMCIQKYVNIHILMYV